MHACLWWGEGVGWERMRLLFGQGFKERFCEDAVLSKGSHVFLLSGVNLSSLLSVCLSVCKSDLVMYD